MPGIRFSPELNLGHLAIVAATIFSAGMAWMNMDSRVSAVERDQRAMKVDAKEATVTAETRLMQRINEDKARVDSMQAQLNYDIRELKQIMRDGFLQLDTKLDRKQDKPGR